MKSAHLILLVAFAGAPLVAAEVDTTKRDEEFAPKPVPQKQVEKKRVEVGKSQPAADDKVPFATVPASAAKANLPAVREKETAPIDMTARPVPTHKPEPARISTGQAAPAKFERKFQSRSAAQIQGGITDAERITASKTKTERKGSVLERINRFVFRRNEPAPVTTTAGGANEPASGASEQNASGSP